MLLISSESQFTTEKGTRRFTVKFLLLVLNIDTLFKLQRDIFQSIQEYYLRIEYATSESLTLHSTFVSLENIHKMFIEFQYFNVLNIFKVRQLIHSH